MRAYRRTERFVAGSWVPTEEPTSLRCWDDGQGPVWVYRDTMGVVGFVRARTWEAAWECCEDAILPDATWEEVADCAEGIDLSSGDLPEGFGHRPNGAGSNGLKEPIYSEDLNGNSLDMATRDMLAKLGYRVSLVE